MKNKGNNSKKYKLNSYLTTSQKCIKKIVIFRYSLLELVKVTEKCLCKNNAEKVKKHITWEG
jgi:hypothetical protein